MEFRPVCIPASAHARMIFRYGSEVKIKGDGNGFHQDLLLRVAAPNRVEKRLMCKDAYGRLGPTQSKPTDTFQSG